MKRRKKVPRPPRRVKVYNEKEDTHLYYNLIEGQEELKKEFDITDPISGEELKVLWDSGEFIESEHNTKINRLILLKHVLLIDESEELSIPELWDHYYSHYDLCAYLLENVDKDCNLQDENFKNIENLLYDIRRSADSNGKIPDIESREDIEKQIRLANSYIATLYDRLDELINSERIPGELSGKDLFVLYRRGDLNNHSSFYTELNLYNLLNYTFGGSEVGELSTEQAMRNLLINSDLIFFCLYGIRKFQTGKRKKSTTQQIIAYKGLLLRRKLATYIKKPKKLAFRVAMVLFLLLGSSQVLVVGTTGINLLSVTLNNIGKKLNIIPKKKYFNNVDEAVNAFTVPRGYYNTMSSRNTMDTVYNSNKNDPIATVLCKYETKQRDQAIFIRIHQYKDSSFKHETETDGNVMEEVINGELYYLSSNYENQQIVWTRNNIVYTLYGEVPREFLKEVILLNY